MSAIEPRAVDHILLAELQVQHSESYSSNLIVSEKPVTVNTVPRSVWGYLKWFIWTAISGVFNCGTFVFEQPFDDHWPVSSTEQNIAEAELDNDSNILNRAPNLHSKNWEVNQNTVTTIDSCTQIVIASSVIENTLPPVPIKEIETFVGEQKATELELNWCLDSANESIDYDLSQSDFDTEDFDYPTNFTELDSYEIASKNGLIDEDTRARVVTELLKSVIPRNLSDSSEVTVSPSIRKMYAWTNQKTDCTENTDNSIAPSKFDIGSNTSGTDEHLAYPGKLTMSDTSFSPLSPATTESSTVISDVASADKTDLGLPNIDRQDHTLAWAMANAVSKTTKSGSAAPTGRPPLPTAQDRRSRDKSPVSTVNSMRLPDTQSMPVFMPFDGFQLYQGYSCFHNSPEDTPKPKRSSSLKSQRTPPGTPGQKAVRFADAFGLDLTSVRHIFDQEAPPKIPASATFDLQLDSDHSIAKLGAKQFGLCFAQPGSAANFIRRVLNDNVCLEDVHIDTPRGVLTGTIRVKSLGFEKRISVRITYNNWATYFDTPASYVHGSHDGATDRFSFSLVVPDTMAPGDRAQFAIRYDTSTGEQFWDNNHGQNYSVTCYAKATDLAGDGSWVHYL